jgi:DNA polymerase
MTPTDKKETQQVLAQALEQTWKLFDDVQQYLGAPPSQELPDFTLRAQQLIPDEQQEAVQSMKRSSLAQIEAMIRTCTRCPLAEKRHHAVPGEGVINARVMVIGEGPGADEDATGRPFVGRAGVYLDSWLKAIGLSRETNTYIANIVKCRPPGNRDPLEDEAAACMPYLIRQVALVKPDAILCVGKVAARFLLGLDDKLKNLRASIHRYQQIPVIVTYHPAAVLRNPQFRAPVWEDLKRVAQLIDMPIPGSRG